MGIYENYRLIIKCWSVGTGRSVGARRGDPTHWWRAADYKARWRTSTGVAGHEIVEPLVAIVHERERLHLQYDGHQVPIGIHDLVVNEPFLVGQTPSLRSNHVGCMIHGPHVRILLGHRIIHHGPLQAHYVDL